MARHQSLATFWLHYLAEHRDPRSRRLHFVGTTAWLSTVGASLVLNPLGFSLALGGMVVVGADAMRRERVAPSLPHVVVMLALPTLASPVLFPMGVAAAYGCAWFGHFYFEGNKPAAFRYPVMSLVCDLLMAREMVRSRLRRLRPRQRSRRTCAAPR